ncbi:protein STICHEL-like isoform X2 [Aristolochia californica]|uniref:protein STICHEL-like isoform X2 n=1 Tax=Aristolochia californica TaxID=171875 RepID=UPI0035E218AD
MSSAFVDPSGLHLKRELTVLRKARFLRDPETSSSWRSPLSSRSVATTSNWKYRNGTREIINGMNNSFGSFEPEFSLPSKSESNRKKIFLYNWRQQSGKSSDSGSKVLQDNLSVSAPRSTGDTLSEALKEDSKSDTYLDDLTMAFRVKEANLETPSIRIAQKLKKNAAPKQKAIRNSLIVQKLDLTSSSLGVLNSVDQSDDTDYCNSEDLWPPPHKFTRKTAGASRLESPLLSGYESWSHSSKIFRSSRREDSSYSYTPASTSSYNRHIDRCPSTVESWDGTTASFDGDEIEQLDLSRSQGCGIPCYWSKKAKYRGCGSCYSPSLSDTIRRKGSSIFCGSQTSLYNKRRSPASHKIKRYPKSSHSLPLLTNGPDGGVGSSINSTSDELSTNFGELDLEALSRLDGRRWSSCRSQDGLELAVTVAPDEVAPDNQSLSQKYRPRFFDELVGQSLAVQSLRNTIIRGKIAPSYLFQGPRGTGKSSAAMIFSKALNCLSADETKPCGFCRECNDFAGKGTKITEVDATNKKGINTVRRNLKNLSLGQPLSYYRIFIIKECHLLQPKSWSAFLKFFERSLPRVVFIFITPESDNLPRLITTHCQKYLFLKIKDTYMITRLRKLAAEENLNIESDALDLIALNSDGSLQDAEMMLEQLSLLGRRITTSLVNDFVGVVSDERLLDLLELAMLSDTAETVKRARELLDSGVDPMTLMSQLAGLIMDIIAGTYRLSNSKGSASFFSGRSLSEIELERLKRALKILSDAEKQLRQSSERSTWFTAALLQLGSGNSPGATYSCSGSKKSLKKAKDDFSDSTTECSIHGKKPDKHVLRWSMGDKSPSMSMAEHLKFDALAASFSCMDRDKLDEIWRRCIEKCHSKTLRQLLCSHGKLVSILETEGALIAYIAFWDEDVKSRAERFLSSITNSIEIIVKHNVEVRIGLIPDNNYLHVKPIELSNFNGEQHAEKDNLSMQQRSDYNGLVSSNQELEGPIATKKNTDSSCDVSVPLRRNFETSGFLVLSENMENICTTEELPREFQSQRIHEVIDEQRLESAWLQSAEKGTPGSMSRLKLERNQVLPQDGLYHQRETGSMMALTVSSRHWEDGTNNEIKVLKVNDNQVHQKDQSNRRVDHYPMSPSLLHTSNFAANFDKETIGYESGPGCNGLFCWKTSRAQSGKVKQGTRVRSHKSAHFSLFGQCRKSKPTERYG